MDKVCILLSAFNGEKYIKIQIESIMKQINVESILVIRDDGSTDKTKTIIMSLKEKYKNKIIYIEGKNLGCEASFFNLLKYNIDADFYAFSDQDDFWMPNKLYKQIEAIKKYNVAALSLCNLLVCDNNLNPIKTMHSVNELNDYKTRMKRDIICNMHGCVMVWNKNLHTILQNNIPNQIVAHDAWLNAIANLIGIVEIISEPLIKYRIHDNNVSGFALNNISKIKKGICIYLGKNHPNREYIAKTLLAFFEKNIDKKTDGYNTLLLLSKYKNNFANKRKLIKNDIVQKRDIYHKYLWIICILMNKF